MVPEKKKSQKNVMILLFNARFRRIIPACCLLIFICSGSQSLSAAAEDQTPGDDHLLSWMTDAFVYKRDGRPDPFTPFIPGKLFEVQVDQEQLTGLRRFEPGQLVLVSIVMTEGEPLAMVQDSIGQGYVIRRGSKIGRSGIVTEIVPNEVVVQKHMLTATGEKKTQTVELVLRKEGEK